MTGTTSSLSFPGVTPGSLQPANGGLYDAFVTEIDAAGATIAYSTFLGGSQDDGGEGIAVDREGNAYLTGYTASKIFPGVTSASIQPVPASFGEHAFVFKIGAGIAIPTLSPWGGTAMALLLAAMGLMRPWRHRRRPWRRSSSMPPERAGPAQPTAAATAALVPGAPKRTPRRPPAQARIALRRRAGPQPRFVWRPALLALLGKMPDGKLARKAGVTRETVFMERRRRGIAAFQAHVRHLWTAESIALLGTASDGDVAAALGVSPGAIFYQRQRLGIPPFVPPPYHRRPHFRWQARHLALLGTMSDQRLAARLHVSDSTVRRQRQRRGIPAFRRRSSDVAWTAEMLELLGRVPDPEVARRHGIPLKAVKTKRRQLGLRQPVGWGALLDTPKLRQILSRPSSEVRRRTGIGWHTICQLRRRLGIEARPLLRRWQPAELAMLGTAPDHQLAERLQRSVTAVRRRRRALHLPRHGSRRDDARRGDAVPSPPDPSASNS